MDSRIYIKVIKGEFEGTRGYILSSTGKGSFNYPVTVSVWEVYVNIGRGKEIMCEIPMLDCIFDTEKNKEVNKVK